MWQVKLFYLSILILNLYCSVSLFPYLGGQLGLANEYFHEVKPGLSAYADDPKQVSRERCGQ